MLHELTQLRQQENTEFEILNLLSHAWLALLKEIDGQKKRIQPLYLQERTKSILSYIHSHYSEKITLADISAYAGISEKECIRSFKNMFHQTPLDYLIHYRIEQAKRLLSETKEPITNIAFMTGFQSSAYFTKTFRKYVAMTPKEFRSLRPLH